MSHAFVPKPLQKNGSAIHYKQNGTGRDSYIYGNNGGFTMLSQPTKFDKSGHMTSMRYSHKKNYSSVASRAMHYKQDGSGRDSYIYYNHGGFMFPNVRDTGSF